MKRFLAFAFGLERQLREKRDVDIIDRNADRLNREAMDMWEYQQLA